VSKHTGRRAPPDDTALFREAIRGVTPLGKPGRPWHKSKPVVPVPVQSLLDVHEALSQSALGPGSPEESMDTGEEIVFLRDGLGRDVLRKLRRGHWVVRDVVDLHGLNREQARIALAEFLGSCTRRGARCLRVVHGKGLRSIDRKPVLKERVSQWLAQRNEVLAFCQAPANQGGSGALLVLLKA
jgi:DNA-nicking Smr family endonuclease